MSTLLIIFLVFLISLLGSVIQSVVGFGYIILSMAIMPMFLPVGQCLVVAQCGGALMSLWILWGKFKEINFRFIAFPALFAAAGSLGGLLFLGSISAEAYMKALGVMLVVLALWMWRFSARFRIRPTNLNGALCGAACGLMGAIFGISVPPLVLYYSSNMRDKDSYMVPLQTTLEIQTAVCLAGRAAFHMWPAGIGYLLPPVILGLFLGKFPGKWIYGRLNTDVLKNVIYCFIAVLGAYTFFTN